MSHQYSTASKVGSVVWSIAIGIGIIALGTTILLPSTKSSRAIAPRHYDEEPATTAPSTQPAQQPQVMPGSKSGAVFSPSK